MRTINNFLSAVLKFIAIVLAILAILYVGLSVYGNIWGDKPAGTTPSPPSVTKAEYSFTIKATGQTIYADSYVTINKGEYYLKDYYRLENGKWRWTDSNLKLNEKYFGPIEVKRRTESG